MTKPIIVLASASPRRKQLLKEMGLKFKVVPSRFKEKHEGMKPDKLALYNAKGKAMYTARREKGSIVIGVDTIVMAGGHILGKPKNDKDAKRTLSVLSGTKHKVISGLCVIEPAGKFHTAIETTIVEIDKLTPHQIQKYIQTGEGKDKAAGYAIQGRGAVFIKSIKGDYFNVVGLPIYRLRKILEKIGIEW
jgi:septum formation protein